MNAPHEFQGTRGEVTVPLSAASRDRLVPASSLRANSARNTLEGSTSAMYWSPATRLSPKPQVKTGR
jgi:hypothetical protein